MDAWSKLFLAYLLAVLVCVSVFRLGLRMLIKAYRTKGGNLRYVEIPDSVTSIADDAFAGSDVTFICNTGSPAYAYAQKYSIPVL